MESTTSYTFTMQTGGIFTSSGIDTIIYRSDRRLLVSPPKDADKAGCENGISKVPKRKEVATARFEPWTSWSPVQPTSSLFFVTYTPNSPATSLGAHALSAERDIEVA